MTMAKFHPCSGFYHTQSPLSMTLRTEEFETIVRKQTMQVASILSFSNRVFNHSKKKKKSDLIF